MDLALIDKQKNKFDVILSVSVSDSFDGFDTDIVGEALLNVDIFMIIFYLFISLVHRKYIPYTCITIIYLFLFNFIESKLYQSCLYESFI